MNTGQIVRAKSVRDFTMVKNDVLRSKSLTIEERGLLVYLLSLPEDWILYKSKLHENMPDSKGTIDRVFKGLQDKGYVISVKVIDTQTKVFKGWNHVVYEDPILEESDTREKPTSAFADIGQSMPIQRQSINTNTDINTNTNTLAKKPKNSFVPPNVEEVKMFFKEKGYTEEAAVKAFNYYTDGNWHDKSGSPVRNWKLKMHVWFKDGYKIQEGKIKVRDIFGSTHLKTQQEIDRAEQGYFKKI
tara:strand:+ start:10504 stop:11235 length:732 start_codon:yes stop_codon:yes gene_type:complete